MNAHILIVDDNEDDILLLSRELKKLKYTFDFALSGSEALEKFSNNRYQILLTDMNMPGMDGKELISNIKIKYPDVICIILSGIKDTEKIVSTLHTYNAYDYLFKPISAELLENTITKADEVYSLRSKCQILNEAEQKVYKDVVNIFDWRKELKKEATDSIAGKIIRQLNITFMQGGGMGALVSSIGMLINNAKFIEDKDIYEVPAMLFSMIKDAHKQSSDAFTAINKVQSILMDNSIIENKINLSDVYTDFKELKDELSSVLEIKNQKISICEPLLATSGKSLNYDRKKMRSVIKELLINAMKYSKNKDTIYLLYMLKDNYLEIKFLNPAYTNSNGDIGIGRNDEELIFEPFYRLTNIVDEKYSASEEYGNGLGLTYVKKIIELHNGHISIYVIDDNLNLNNKKSICVNLRFPLL